MKPFLFSLCIVLSSCTTTTTVTPDGTKLTVTTSDPKVVSEISGVVARAADAVVTIETIKTVKSIQSNAP